MQLSLYSAASGMEAQQLNLSVISHNLANANTTGFKRSKIEFQDLLYHQPKHAGAETGDGNVLPTGVEIGHGTDVISTAKVFTQGTLKQTGGMMDLAIEGDGFFEVQLPDGTSGYTRAGALKVGSDGRVSTSDGLPVLSGFEPLQQGYSSIAVSASGEVSVQTPDGQQNFRIQLTRFNNPAGLRSMGDNLFAETVASGTPEQGLPRESGFGGIIQNHLEISNVNIVEEMVNMIMAQRAYEVNSKSIQTSDQMLQQVAQLKR